MVTQIDHAMHSKISTILFDADGVLQYPAGDYECVLRNLLGSRANEAEQFFTEMFRIERASLDGKGDFQENLVELLERWDLLQGVEQVLTLSTQIKPSAAILSTISALRSRGVLCCLASNQQSYRARFMSKSLGYSNCFDKEFYSCDLGFVKPDPRYFESVLAELGKPPHTILFIDDQEANVVAARSVGLHGTVFSASHETGDQILRAILSDYEISVQSV